MELEQLARNQPGFHDLSGPEKIKVLAWYLHHKGKKAFSTSDINACFDALFMEKPNTSTRLFEMEQRGDLLRTKEGLALNGRLREQFNHKYLPKTPTSIALEKVKELAQQIKERKIKAFLEEAALCIEVGACRAAIVLGWCATIHHLHRKVGSIGFDKFSQASSQMKAAQSGPFKRWNKEFSVHNTSDLIPVFDSDLIQVLAGMNLIDSNEVQRLLTCFQWRCHSAHPAEAPIGEAHMLAFFTDVVHIVLANPQLQP